MFTLTPSEQIHVEAFCQAENGEGYIMRIWNSGDAAVDAGFTTALKIGSVEKVRMDEAKSFGPLASTDGGWTIPLRAKEIATLYLK
jgi:alpha-mannosidase